MGVIFKNNVMYGAGDIEISPVCYSEEEQEVGCWIDGKSLYQKTFVISNLATGRIDFAHNISNIDNLWLNHTATHFMTGDNNSAVSYYGGGYDDTGRFVDGYSNIIQLTKTYITIKLQSSSACKNGTLYAVLNYTKTTDTPGSGIWTPQGVPAVHYSTDEHVVGTWIDGSTLYEKTIIGTADYDVTGLNVVEIFGIGKTTSGAVIPFPYNYSGDYLLVWVGVYSGTNLMKVATNYTLSELYRAIRYTKTTS